MTPSHRRHQQPRRPAFLALAVAILALAALVSACGGSGSDGSEDGGTPESGGTLTIIQPRDAQDFDPIIDPGAEGIYILEQVMEGLMRINADQSIGPGLASRWKVSKDQLTWRFTLRKGVTFSNGDPFNADAVLFSFERLMDVDGPASFSALYDANIESVDKVDDYHVNIVMKHPWPAFPIYASTNHTKIVNPRQVKEAGKDYGYSELPIGTGPFKFESWNKDQQAVLVRNPDYWQKGRPKLDEIVYKTVPDATAATLQLTSGEADVLQDPAVDQVPQLRDNPDVEVMAPGGGGQYVIVFNMSKPPFDDARVRLAFELGINSQQIVDSVFHGTAEVPHGFFPKWFWGHDADFSVPYDPERAKQLLAEAGYSSSKPLSFSFMVYNTPPYTDVGQLIQAQLAKIGVQVKVRPFEYQTVVSAVRPEDPMHSQVQAAMYRHIARNNHWEFTGNRLSANGKLNHSSYNKEGGPENPEAQKLFDQAEFLRDDVPSEQAKAKEIYGTLERIIYGEDVPEIIVVRPNNLNVVKKRVHDFPNGAYNWAPLWDVWVSR
jgi:peptide/nickel transport system substrate-binding protein